MIVRLLPLLIVLLLRFYHLDARPPHHDESVNGWFVDGILSRGYYVYDPANYHGPLFFYVLTLFEKIFGRSIEVLRYPTVIFGSLIAFTPFLFKKWLGNTGAWIAALFFVFSPAFIFYSRYSIHETLFVFATILFFYFWLSIKETGFVRKNILGFGFSLGAMACLKENFVLFGASLGLAEGLLFLYDRKSPVTFNRTFWKGLVFGTAIAALIVIIFFSGFFQVYEGVPNFFKAFKIWFETGEKGNGHSKPFLYWIKLMGTYEWFALLGLCLAPFALGKVPRELKLLSGLSVGLWLIYSLVSYKTPWCVLSFEWGFILISAFWIGKWFQGSLKVLIIPGLMLGLSICAYQAYDVAYLNTDQENHVFIYGQTYRDMMVPVNEIIAKGKSDPSLHATLPIQVISAFTWPFPYLLGEFKSTGYYGEGNAPAVLDAEYVIMDKNFEPKLLPRLKGTYRRSEVRSRQWALPVLFFTKTHS